MRTLLAIILVSVAATSAQAQDGKLRIIAFGPHPDDCEWSVGGVAALWARAGHHVKFVSVTNGDIGHFQQAGGPLARRRTAEVQQAARILGIEATQVLDIHDGELLPTLENRRTIARLIREWKADVVLGPRPNDYHPDHRYTGVLVNDAAYMVTVPFFTEVPPLTRNPVFLYYEDGFQRPNPFTGDVVVPTDASVASKADALAALVSQTTEGGAEGNPSMLPKNAADAKARADRARQEVRTGAARTADRFRAKLTEELGAARAGAVKAAEAFEVCEYGRRPSPEELRKLFPLP
jgi:LmbE family N-acetylglucosaminyl deacetylase